MIGWLKALFLGVFALMLYATVTASLDRSVFAAGGLLSRPLVPRDPADADCGFLTSYAWVFYRERSWAVRVSRFAAIMLLGNIAIALYMLAPLFRLPAGAGPEQLLLRPRA